MRTIRRSTRRLPSLTFFDIGIWMRARRRRHEEIPNMTRERTKSHFVRLHPNSHYSIPPLISILKYSLLLLLQIFLLFYSWRLRCASSLFSPRHSRPSKPRTSARSTSRPSHHHKTLETLLPSLEISTNPIAV